MNTKLKEGVCNIDDATLRACCAKLQKMLLPKLSKLRQFENKSESLFLRFIYDEDLGKDFRELVAEAEECCSCLDLECQSDDHHIELSVRHIDGESALQAVLQSLFSECCVAENPNISACC